MTGFADAMDIVAGAGIHVTKNASLYTLTSCSGEDKERLCSQTSQVPVKLNADTRG